MRGSGERAIRRSSAGVRAAVTLGGTALAVVAVALPASAAGEQPERLLLDARITESSGLASSGLHASVVWTHNDAGHSAQFYAVGADGMTRAAVDLPGVAPLDWEAIAQYRDAFGTSWLFVGDIGSNAGDRSEVVVHQVPEPTLLVDQTAPYTSYRLAYPDGGHDAEALLVDPRSGQVFVVTKEREGAGAVYAAPAVLSPTDVNVLTRVADAPSRVTDGCFLPDGRVVLRDYDRLFTYAGIGAGPTSSELPPSRQGESVAPTPDGLSVLVGSEGSGSALQLQPLP